MRAETTPTGQRIIAEEDFTASHAAGQRDVLEQCLAEAGVPLRLDMEAVAAIDGRGLALLSGLAATCRRQGIPLHFEAVRPELQRLLRLCALPGAAGINGAADD